MAIHERQYAAADLWALSQQPANEHRRLEVDEGALVEMSPTGDRHGVVAAWLLYLIMDFVTQHDLGEVAAAETGFVLTSPDQAAPETVRAPDIAFIAKARLEPVTGGYYKLAPDFAAEVVSPTDSAAQTRRKADQYLRAGTRLVWIIYPEDRLIDVYQPEQAVAVFHIDDTLDGGDVFPGLRLPVRRIFERLRD